MRHRTLSVVVALVLTGGAAHADEGMWMQSQLPQLAKQLKAAGFKGNPADLADLIRHPMSAVVSIGGCTASFVSPQGLAVTNHHCALGAIQLNSTAERNLIQDGFIAASMADEPSAGPAAPTLAMAASTTAARASPSRNTGRYSRMMTSSAFSLSARSWRPPASNWVMES